MKISKADCPEMIKDTTPVQDGFFMPGEFEQHQGCIMIWPERPGSWRNGAKEAETAFSAVIRAIAASETVYVAAGKKGIDHAKAFAESLKKKKTYIRWLSLRWRPMIPGRGMLRRPFW